MSWLGCDWIEEGGLKKTWNLSKAYLALEMRQSFLIKMNLLQCFQFSLLPCNVLLCMAVQDREHSRTFQSEPFLLEKQYLIGTRIREVLSCAVLSVELPCCFSLSMLQFRTAVTEWLCSCLDMGPNIFRCALTITGKAFICSAAEVPITYRSCS